MRGSGLPGILTPRYTSRRGRGFFHYRAEDLSVQPLTGPALTFSRGSVSGMIRDSLGRGRFPVQDAPRLHCFDLDGDGVFETPTLLLEPSRINRLLRSQELDNAAWTKTRASASANAVLAPDGTLTADKLVEDSSVTTTHLLAQSVTLGTSGARVALSVFVRAAERSNLRLRVSNGANLALADFNVSTLAAPFTSAGGTGSVVKAYYEKWTDGSGAVWIRCVLVGVADSGSTSCLCEAFLSNGASTSYTGDGTSGLYLWGWQLEETDNLASSHVPTVGATATRSAESLTATWLLPPGPLSIYASLIEIGQGFDPVSSKRLVQIGDGTTRSILLQSASGVRTEHDNGPSAPGSTLSVSGLDVEHRLEVCGTIANTGAPNIAYSLNSGAVQLGTPGSAAGFAGAYGGSPVKLALGSQEGTAAYALMAIRHIKLAAGALTMDQMRSLL